MGDLDVSDEPVENHETGAAAFEAPPEGALLAPAAQLAAVSAAALPLLGFLTRQIAFGLCARIGSPGASHLAAADSLSDLTVAGIAPFFGLGLTFVVAAVIQSRLSRRRPKRRASRGRTIALVALALAEYAPFRRPASMHGACWYVWWIARKDCSCISV